MCSKHESLQLQGTLERPSPGGRTYLGLKSMVEWNAACGDEVEAPETAESSVRETGHVAEFGVTHAAKSGVTHSTHGSLRG
jgi:hypothetical protein